MESLESHIPSPKYCVNQYSTSPPLSNRSNPSTLITGTERQSEGPYSTRSGSGRLGPLRKSVRPVSGPGEDFCGLSVQPASLGRTHRRQRSTLPSMEALRSALIDRKRLRSAQTCWPRPVLGAAPSTSPVHVRDSEVGRSRTFDPSLFYATLEAETRVQQLLQLLYEDAVRYYDWFCLFSAPPLLYWTSRRGE